MTKTPPARPVLGAIAVVVCAGRVLLVRRKKDPDAGKWGFAGGHVERGETALAAAARELHEETSVVATPVQYLTNLDIITRDARGIVEHHFLLAAVLCRYESGTPVPSDEVSHAEWVEVDRVTTLDRSAHVEEMIALAMTYDGL